MSEEIAAPAAPLAAPKPPYSARVDRRQFRRGLWLFGDSVFRGHALNWFEDALPAERADQEPLWPFRSPASMINLFLSDTSSLTFDSAGIPANGSHVAAFLGTTMLPERPGGGVSHVRRAVRSGMIQPGDTLAFLDAGLHFANPRLHEEAWRAFRRAAAIGGVRVLFCTAFDNLANDSRPTAEGGPKELRMHDIAWEGGRSHNDALREVVADDTLPGDVSLLDLNAIMADWQERMASRFGVRVYRRDNIHPNVWGQLRMSWALFSAAWPDLAARTFPRSTEILARAMWDKLQYGAAVPGWSGKAAVEAVRLCTGFVAEELVVRSVEVA